MNILSTFGMSLLAILSTPLGAQQAVQPAHAASPPPVYAADWPADHARVRPVPLPNVKAAGFLGARIERNARSLLKALESPFPRGFEARAAGREPGPEIRRLAADSDLYKWIEGAAYTVALTGDPAVARELDRIAVLVTACQQPDGYINTQVPPYSRFDSKISHELYVAGHFFEAAVAHYRTTGKRTLLDAAVRWADYLLAEHERDNPYFRTVAQKEHSEYELGFLRLGRATGNRKYTTFAATLADLIPVGPDLFSGRYAVGGHAVRVNYLLAGYADLYLETGEARYRQPLAAVWDDIVANRFFVTGGVSVHERYREPHHLPQVTDHLSRDIAETCTSISLMMFTWRMHSLTGESQYFDRIETILYNHFLGGPSLDQMGTFYYNPLKWLGEPKNKTDHGGPMARRTMLPAIHSTSCCLPNEYRFFGALSEYLFSYDDRGLMVNLYTSGTVRHALPSGTKAQFSIETRYPHDGRIVIRAENEVAARLSLRLRIPAWCQKASLRAPDAAVRQVKAGYAEIDRIWRRGDEVTLTLDMPPRLILPDPREKDHAGQAVLARGPLVYCLEQADARFPIANARWDFAPERAAQVVKVEWKEELLGGVNVLSAPGRPGPLTLVPYYARANRGEENHWMTFLPLSTGGEAGRKEW